MDQVHNNVHDLIVIVRQWCGNLVSCLRVSFEFEPNWRNETRNNREMDKLQDLPLYTRHFRIFLDQVRVKKQLEEIERYKCCTTHIGRRERKSSG